MIRCVHALRIGVRIALFALCVVSDWRAQARQEPMMGIARHLFTVLGATFRSFALWSFRTAILRNLGGVRVTRIVSWPPRLQIRDGNRLTNSTAMLASGS